MVIAHVLCISMSSILFNFDLGCIYFFIKRYFNLIYILLTILFLVELGICYHSLTTFGIIEYTGCEAATLPNDITKLKEELMSNTLITTCSDANLPYFGIPLSVYNFVFNDFSVINYFQCLQKKNKSPSGEDKKLIEEIIRVDHAGEHGATQIYRGQLAIFKENTEFVKKLRRWLTKRNS